MSHPFSQTLRSPAALTRFLLVAAIGLGLDLWTKWLAFHTLLLTLTRYPDNTYAATSKTYDLIPGWLRFEVTVNQGAVFGIGQGQRFLFLLVSAAAVGFLGYLFFSSKPRQWFYQILLGMLLAGVLGNVYDRALYGYVRDMIHIFPGWPNPLRTYFPSWQYIFPWIFNIADSLLCVGVALMLVYTLFSPGKNPATDTESQPGHTQSQQV
jgi:signal peptidase II